MHRSPWVALDATTDRRRHALALARAHDAVLSGARTPALVRDVIERSWQRSSGAGVDPGAGIAPCVVDADTARERWERHPLSIATPMLRELLADVRDDAQQVVLVCDADGTLLWIDGEPATLDAARAVHLEPGASWGEREAGTNAMGTALATGHPLQVFSAEHFAAPVHGWTCSAAPVHDPATGDVLGVIDLSGELSTAHPHSLALVTAAARMVETRLAERAAAGPGPVVRRRRRDRAAPVALELLGRDRAVLRAGARRLELTPRHSEIVALLAGEPDGLGQERLAIALYGDFGKPVSVRAELSRLRRLLGDGLQTHPYRLSGGATSDAAEVEALVAAGRLADAVSRYAAGPLLPTTEVALLVEARQRLEHTLRSAVLRSGDAGLLVAWLQTPSGDDDLEACRRALAVLGEDDQRREAVLSRLRRLSCAMGR